MEITENPNTLIQDYSTLVKQDKDLALEFIDKNKDNLNQLWPNAYRDFLLNIKTRYLKHYESERDIILDQLVSITEAEQFYTSHSAMVSNFLRNSRGLENVYPAKIDKLRTFLKNKPTRFSIDYFITTISAELGDNCDANTVDKFYSAMSQLTIKAMAAMSSEELSAMKYFYEGKNEKSINSIALEIYKRLEMELFDYKIVSVFKEKYKNEKPTFNDIPKDCQVLYNGEHGLIVVPQTVEAFAKVTRKTVWCVSDPNDNPAHRFYKHPSNSYVYISPDKKICGWMIDVTTGLGKFAKQHSNKHIGLNEQDARTVPPIAFMFDLIEDEILKKPKSTYYYILTVIQAPWPKGEETLKQHPKYYARYKQFLDNKGEKVDYIEEHRVQNFLWNWLVKQWWVLKFNLKTLLGIRK